MSEKILVPALGESISEATVSKWLKQKGEIVEADEPIVELETDKVNLEVPSPVSGVLTEINSKDGSVVAVGALLGLVKENDNEQTKQIETKTKDVHTEENNVISIKEQAEKQEPKIFDQKEEQEPLVLKEKEIEEDTLILTNEVDEQKTKISTKSDNTLSPAVRKIISEKKIDIDMVEGSGKDGRILKGDLINLMGATPPPSERKIKYGHEERIKMTRLRQTIAKRLKQAQENAAILTTFNEVDMTNIMDMRKRKSVRFSK